MRVLTLKSPHLNGFKDENDPLALQYVEDFKAVRTALTAGDLYCRFIKGDRKGSIAHLAPNPKYRTVEAPYIGYFRQAWDRSGPEYRVENTQLYALCSWTGRRNTASTYIPHHDIELLLDYDGPTVWEKFDTKAAKAKALENPDQKDIDGNVLQIGDRVLYINARYGSRMTLTRGTLTEFKVTADSRSTSITTIVTSDDGTVSELTYPESMVSRI